MGEIFKQQFLRKYKDLEKLESLYDSLYNMKKLTYPTDFHYMLNNNRMKLDKIFKLIEELIEYDNTIE